MGCTGRSEEVDDIIHFSDIHSAESVVGCDIVMHAKCTAVSHLSLVSARFTHFVNLLTVLYLSQFEVMVEPKLDEGLGW